LTYGAAWGANALANRGANQGFKVARGKKPPLNPASRKTSWKSALTYGAITGALGAMAGIAGRRAVTGLWRSKVGRLPTGER
jgi:hypothetical protein